MLQTRNGFHDIFSWDRNVGDDVDQSFDHGVRLRMDIFQFDSVRNLQRSGGDGADDESRQSLVSSAMDEVAETYNFTCSLNLSGESSKSQTSRWMCEV